MIEYFMKHGLPGWGMKTEECQDDEYDGDDDDDKDNDCKESNTRSLTRSRLALE